MDALLEDLRQMTGSWEAPPTRVVMRSLARLPLYPRMRAVVAFRASAWCWRHQLRPVALWLQARSIRSAGTEIHPAATIGPGLLLFHSVGIVVGHQVVAGENLSLYQGVTLGHTGTKDGQPILGNNVRVGAGAKVLGPVRIGDDVRIGANAIVLADVGDGQTVTGVWRG